MVGQPTGQTQEFTSAEASAMPADDYRHSHVGKGADYDAELAKAPWERYMKEREYDIVTHVVRALFPTGVPRYLDFACGTGRMTSLVERMATESIGVDVSESMLALARAKCQRTTFLKRDLTLEAPGFGPVDLVTAFRFFGNAQQALRSEVIAVLSRLVRPGGFLVLNNHRNPASPLVRIANWRGDTDPADLVPRRLEELLQSGGFSVRNAFGVGAWFLHQRQATDRVMDSRIIRRADAWVGRTGLYRWCPDYVLVCRRVAAER